MGAVLIEGPKACGKTLMASQLARTIIRFDEDPASRSLLDINPRALFSGRPPILFDEWQLAPEIWNRVRRQVDDRATPGQFILTGSATPRDNADRHSGSGRFAVLQLRPMSLVESGHSCGEISLSELLCGVAQDGDGTSLRYEDLLHAIVTGGWPQLIGQSERIARRWLRAYLKQVIEVDIPGMGHRRNPGNLERLLASPARGVGHAVKIGELAKDVGGPSGPVAHETLTSYLDALDRLNLVENAPAWRPHMRSRTQLRAAPVRHFVDPSLGPAALGVGTTELAVDPRAADFHFEALVLRDLRIYAQPLDAAVDSYRDSNGDEIDAIVRTIDGGWAAFEVKLNPCDIDRAATALLRISAGIDPEKHGEPAALGVITGGGHGGRRPDGVHVIPIGTLGP